MQSESASIEQILRRRRMPQPAIDLYLTMLQEGPIDIDQAAGTSSEFPARTKAIEHLLLMHLITFDFVRGHRVLFVIDPEIAWAAHSIDLGWRTQEPSRGDPEERRVEDETRDSAKLLEDLASRCTQLHRGQTSPHDPFKHKHRDLQDASHFMAWLALAIGSAKDEVVAVEVPPRSSAVAPFWSALRRQMDAGLRYTRIIGTGEILEHGLDIVRRDITKFKINLRVAPLSELTDAFYLIDGRLLFLKNLRGLQNSDEQPFFGRFTTHAKIVERYKVKFRERYVPLSIDGLTVVERLEEIAEDHRRSLSSSPPECVDVFDRVSRMGKFAQIETARRPVLPTLEAMGVLSRNESGFFTMRAEGLDDLLGRTG
jgi:hypothetical protein